VQARGGLRSGSRRRPVSALWLEWLQSILHWRHIYLTQVLLKIRSPALPLLVLLFYVSLSLLAAKSWKYLWEERALIPAAAAAAASTRLVHHISCVCDTTRTRNISSPTQLKIITTQETPKNHPQRTESPSQKVQGRSRESDGREECNHKRSQAIQTQNQSEKESSEAICNPHQLTPVNQTRIFLHFISHIRRGRRWGSCPPHASCASRRTVVARRGGFQTATGVEGGRETLMNKLVELGIETVEHLWSLWAPAMPVRLAMCSSGDYSNNVG
jgi:hypothetical protein